MDSKLLCLSVVLATIIYVANGGGGKCTSGSFNYNGAECTYKEMGQKNSHQRTLRLSCEKNKKQNRAALKCSYKGDPHKDPWYNKNHQADFYRCLKDELVNSKILCTATTVKCKKHASSVIFYLQNNDALELERFGTSDVINLESDDSEDIEPFGMLSDDSIGFESFNDDDDDDGQIYRPYV